jgi:pimeloyl-ACP methyl ester carboxylesterase
MPGFGCPVPAGWGATKEEYTDWLIAEAEKAGEPVDIVGHDWGALLVARVASLRPDLVRSWAICDAAIDEAYVWHTMKDCILKLYRSAVEVGKEWQPATEKMERPGLMMWGGKDPYMQVDYARKMAQRTGAKLTVFEDSGHWLPLEKPAEVAAALEEFWANL